MHYQEICQRLYTKHIIIHLILPYQLVYLLLGHTYLKLQLFHVKCHQTMHTHTHTWAEQVSQQVQDMSLEA